MLRTKPSSTIEVVSVHDTALHELPVEAVREYELSRDISVLGDLNKLATRPTVFTCKPLAQRFENLLDTLDADAVWHVFANHVTTATGLLDENDKPIKLPMEEVSGGLVVGKEAREMLGREIVNEVAGVIIQRCNGRDGSELPFVVTSSGSWQHARIQSQTLHALRKARAARVDQSTESATSSETTDEDSVNGLDLG